MRLPRIYIVFFWYIKNTPKKTNKPDWSMRRASASNINDIFWIHLKYTQKKKIWFLKCASASGIYDIFWIYSKCTPKKHKRSVRRWSVRRASASIMYDSFFNTLKTHPKKKKNRLIYETCVGLKYKWYFFEYIQNTPKKKKTV